MRTLKLFLLLGSLLATCSVPAMAAQGANTISPMALDARGMVVSLYRQHKKRSPFFQTKSRVMLDRYFTKELADLIWRDARSSGDEVGALDGDPLYDAQDMEITNFTVHDGAGGPRAMVVPVTFENFGKPHEIKFRLFATGRTWKIGNIEYDEGTSLMEILKTGSAEHDQTIKIYLVAVGDNGKTGKKIGCEDSLVPVTRTIKKTPAPLTAAIRELLQTPQHPQANPNLENFWKGRNLKVKSIVISNHTATIYLAGEVSVAGICDEPRIQSQIQATALQFSTVKRVKVFIGKRTLADAIR
jgi:hypothetical protein